MNTENSALFLYCLELLFGDTFSQKDVVFTFKDRLFTAQFYESSPFDESVHKAEFKKSFFNTFLDDDSFGDQKHLLQNNLIGTFEKFEKFSKKSKIHVSDLNIVPKEVTFLDLPETIFPFFVIDSKESITPVSFLSKKE